jgi:DNA helicase-2/ATP-dependent DNA helicase PcrA
LAVGDDDQAVYKFQGAEISNILDFRDSFDGVKIVTLKNNYRSTQDILDVATHVIRKGEERLENVVPEIQKTIVASNKNIKGGLITGKIFPTNVHEYSFIAKEIKKLIEEGKDPKEIAVISRNHRELEEIAPYLANNGIAINYERQQNVLAEPHIHQLITIAKFINSLNKKEKDEADELLPEILSYPFWQFERKDVWEISLKAKSGEKLESWLDVMLKSEKKKIRNIAKFFLELSKQAEYEPLETMLDKMIGSHTALLADTEDDDDCGESFYRFKNNAFFSPFKDYYFSREIFNNKKVEYLVFLSGLRVFVQSLREYKNGQELKIKDLVEFVDLHEKNEIPINDESPFANAYEAVNLLTSHKAKGLEFEVVFVLSCQEDIWAGRGRGNNLPFPQNLPVYPAGENLDDQLRLFYVALTRAKSHLYLTSYEKNSAGKESLRLQFLIPGQSNNQKMKDILNPLAENFSVSLESLNMPVYSWLNYYKLPRLEEEEILLKLLVKDYQMSVTHLNNFLNVEKGGPQLFMEQNLLRFPQSKTPSGCYGSAVHKSFEILYTQLRKNGKILPLKDLLLIFKNQLEKQRLSKKDFELYLEKGKLALTAYYNAKKKDFDPKNKIEVNFKNQGVVVGEAKLNGKIDKIVTEGNDMIVCDLKTGKPKLNWDGKNPYEKIQLTEYKRQLMFYKILIENSREFGGKYRVGKGILEFVEPTTSGKNIDLSLDIDNASVERLKRLIKIIYKKITELDFPSIENYSKDINGIIAFENDLLNDKV